MRRQASTPLPSGSRTSISTTSGRVCSLSCTASADGLGLPDHAEAGRVGAAGCAARCRTTVWSSTIRTRIGSAGAVVMSGSPHARDRERRLGLGLVAVERHRQGHAGAARRVLAPRRGARPGGAPARACCAAPRGAPARRRAPRGGGAAAVVGDDQVDLVGGEDERSRARGRCRRGGPCSMSASRRICSRCWPASSGRGPRRPRRSTREAHVAAGLLGEAPGQLAEAGGDALGRGGRAARGRGCSRGCRRWPRSGRPRPRAPRARTDGSSERMAIDSRWRPAA